MSVGSIYAQYRNANMISRARVEAGTAGKNASSDKVASDAVNRSGAGSHNSLRKLESQDRTKEKQMSSVVDQSMSYAKQLSASRTSSKKASLEKKKLQYNFKKISSQIIRSKNSVSARKAVQAARREVMRLKRLMNGGEYDEEELQLAIDHAKAMEEVARKKVSHLEQEEMIERHGKGLSGELEEVKEKNEDSESADGEGELSDEEVASQDIDGGGDQASSEADLANAYDGNMYLDISDTIEDYDYEMALELQELQESMSDSFQMEAQELVGSVDDMMDELMDEMSQMLEDMDLSELAESTYAPDPNMSEDDLKILKIKHRYKELKEIAEADKEYLKGVMEHQKKGQATGMPTGFGSALSPSAIFKSAASSVPVISMPGSAGGGSAPVLSGGFDISI